MLNCKSFATKMPLESLEFTRASDRERGKLSRMELDDRSAANSIEADELRAPLRCGVSELAPPDVYDPVIEAYKKAVDQTLLIENLKLTPAQRAEKFQDFMHFLAEIRRAGQKLRGENP